MIQLSKYYIMLSIAFVITLISCQNFEEINTNLQNVEDESLIKIEFLLNESIYSAQQDPAIASIIFLGIWNRASRYEIAGGVSIMKVNDDWSKSYWSMGRALGWIKSADLAVKIGEKRLMAGVDPVVNPDPALTKNIVNIARIWRVYLYSELTDNFGPLPRSEAFMSDSIKFPTFDNVESIYKWMIEELTDAVTQIDPVIKNEDFEKYDQLFQGDFKRWIKYANSMRLRLAMRLSNAAPTYAQAQFEAAVATDNFITELDDIASVQEGGGWVATTGVMTRDGYWQQLSLTMANLSFGLGGIPLTTLKGVQGLATHNLPDDVITNYGKDPNKYIGLEMPNYLSSKTNVTNAGYFFDAIPDNSDPRLFKNYSIPGYNDGTVSMFPYQNQNNLKLANTTDIQNAEFKNVDGKNTSVATIDTIVFRGKYTFHGRAFGETGAQSTIFSKYTNYIPNSPSKSAVWRNNNQKRVFFAPWEAYFLLAEASLYGWNTGTDVVAAYNTGITSNFEYMGITQLTTQYIASTSYNRIGTSVAISHVTEAPNLTLESYDLKTNLVVDKIYPKKGSDKLDTIRYKVELTIPTNVTYTYPKGLYITNNDILTKIITQKYIAQCPWLPLEAWSDYRRLGLPFMENPIREQGISTMPEYKEFDKFSLDNIPGRLDYPQKLDTNNPNGYKKAVEYLGGSDEVKTKLWWAKKENK